MTVILSFSRTAMVVCLALFPLAIALRGNRRSIISSVVMLVIAATVFGIAVASYEPLYDRFFKFDASLDIGGVAVNASGRTAMWNTLLDTLGDRWVFGKGIASSGDVIDLYFPNLGHPHNDFLRFYYDLGVVGLLMWLAFIALTVQLMWRKLRLSISQGSADYPLHLAALLAVAAVSCSMFTDNPVSYCFVMIPLGIVIGCSVGSSPELDRAALGVRLQNALNHRRRAAAVDQRGQGNMASPALH